MTRSPSSLSRRLAVLITLCITESLAKQAKQVKRDNFIFTAPDLRRILPANHAYLAACVVAKDPNPHDVMEWLVYHLALGVGHVYWYDHNASVDLSRLVAPFVQAGQLTWIQVHEPGSENPETKKNVQSPAYHHCVDTHSIHHDWMMFIDADEFLWVRDAQVSGQGQELPLHALLKEYQGFAGLGVNWLFYGSSGHDSRPTDTTMRSYTKCVHKEEPRNDMRDSHLRLTKYIVHTARQPTPFRFHNPHSGLFILPQPDPTTPMSANASAQRQPVVDELYRPLLDPSPHLTHTHTSERIAVLHYVLRSREEWAEKVARGSGDGGRKDFNFFKHIDQVSTKDCTVELPLADDDGV